MENQDKQPETSTQMHRLDRNSSPAQKSGMANVVTPCRLDLELFDGYRTYVYFYPPPAGVKRLEPVLYVHGIQSHPGWFGGSSGALATAGFPVYQVARRGSGENRINPGHADSANQLFDDIDCAIDFVLAQEKIGDQNLSAKVNLLGVSWGGKLLSCYCLGPDRAKRVKNLVLVAPGIVPQVDVGVSTKLAIAASLIFGGGRLFPIPLNEVELFTDNPARQQFLLDDSLRLHKATARFLFVSRMLDTMLKNPQAHSLRLPTTLLQANRDRIIDNKATKALLSKLAGENLQVHNLPAAHTIEFEQDPGEFYGLLVKALVRP